jgi:bifunctional non-homologous end joining protein LigD
MGRWRFGGKRRPERVADAPGAMPSLIEPELATLVRRPPVHGDWSYEIKFDGYRMLTRIESGDVRLITRNGYNWTGRMQHLRDELQALPVSNAWLDGEAVVLNAAGVPDFNALQNSFDRRRTADIVLFVFDLLWVNGADLRAQPLRFRRALLRTLLGEFDSSLVRYSGDFPHDPVSLLSSAREMKLEGIIGKRSDSPYRSGRTTDWIKLKCNTRQEFVVGGIARANGATAGVRSLLLGVFENDGSLKYAGHVHPHLSPRQSAALHARIERLKRVRPPFRNAPSPERDEEFVWVKPDVVVEVSFLEWTPNREIRHPVFEGIREDKPARAVTEEQAVEMGKTPEKTRARGAGGRRKMTRL